MENSTYKYNYVTQIRDLVIGIGRPKIAASIMAYDEEGFLEKARLADESNCDIIEIRADSMAMGGYREPEKIKKIVERIKTVTEKPLILTIRSMEEGGMANIDRTSYYMLIRDIIEIFDLEKIKPEVLDIEAFDKDYGARSDMMEFMVNLAHDAGMKVIVSNHDVEKTPKIGEMVERIMIMDKFGADIPKGAYMARSEGDVNNVMEAVKVVAQKIKKPYILISMGEEGKKTRISFDSESGNADGTAITFGCLGSESSAKGQMEVNELKSRVMEKCGDYLNLT